MKQSEITLHRAAAQDFSASGVGYLHPLDACVQWVRNGMYQLELTLPINDPLLAEVALGAVIVAPVPVSETPSLDVEATQERQIYKVSTNGGRLHLRSGPGTKHKIISKYKNGTEIVVLDTANTAWYRVAAPDGASGYMSAGYLAYVRTEPGAEMNSGVIETKPVRCQPFRISRIQPGIAAVNVCARHIFYDLSDNLILPKTYSGVNRQTAMNALLADCLYQEHGFTAWCEGGAAAELEFKDPKSPAEAMLDSDGLIDKLGGEIMRDWYDVYVVDRLGRDRGISIRYGLNMLSLDGAIDADDMATRIVPIGTDKEGEALYLPDVWIEAPENQAQIWPHPRFSTVRVDDAKVRDDMTVAQAREKMTDKAQALFEDGAGMANVSIKVEFVEGNRLISAGDMAKLQKLFPGDDVLVVFEPMGIRSKLRLVEYTYDCLMRRFRAATLGSADRDVATVGIDPRQLPSGGITGGKLASGTVAAQQLANGSVGRLKIGMGAIEIAHIGQAAINSLNAAALTAITAAINQLTAGDVSANALYAAFAHVIELAAGSISAGNLTTDQLAAALAQVVSLHAKTGEFDLATVENLLANALVLRQGAADSMMITNLAVTSANLLSAVVGNLVLKGTDGKYYQIFIGPDGEIHAEETSASPAAGQPVVETTANLEALTASNLLASSAVIGEILTDALSAGQITAAEALIASATIPALYTTSIQAIGEGIDLSANHLIQLLLGGMDTVNRWFTFDNHLGLVIRKPAWTDADGVEHPASPWSTVTDETGYHIKRADMPGYVGSFARDRLVVEGVQVGDIVARRTAAGGWAWTDSE